MYVRIITYLLSFFDQFNKSKVIDFFQKSVKGEIDNFIDVGAHYGETINLFNKNFIIKNFFAFECSPLNFEALEKKVQKIDNLSVKIFNYALGEKKKTMLFNQSIESSSSSLINLNENSKYLIRKKNVLTFFNPKSYSSKKIEVEVNTLKNL